MLRKAGKVILHFISSQNIKYLFSTSLSPCPLFYDVGCEFVVVISEVCGPDLVTRLG